MQSSLMYEYQISKKIKLGAGINMSFLQSALLENKVIKNNLQVTKDSLYGIDRTNKEWGLLRQNFLTSKLEAGYQFKKLEVGLDIITPISSVFKQKTNNPSWINTNVFIRWQFK